MNPIHSSYGRERGYQAQGDPSTYVEDNRKSEQFRAELEDTSEQQDPKAGKSKRQWGISGLKEMHLAARAKVTKTPKVPPATPDHPAPLRIVKPPNAFELSADDTSRRNPQSQNASSASHIVPNDPSGIKYIYNKGANGLIRNPNARNLSSFGSTTAQADTSVVSDGDGTDEESPRLRLPRRALSSVPVASSDVNEAGGDNADNASNLMFANIVLRACLKYPELKGFGEESPQVAITRIFETYGNVTTPLRDRNGHLDPSGSSKKDLLKVDNDLRAARTELVDRNDEISRHEEETVTLNRQITSLKYRIRELETANDIRARNDLRALQAENERIKSMYEHQLRKEREDIHSERSKLNRRQKDDERVINDLNARLLKENTLWSQACTRLKDDNADLEDRLHAAKEEEDKRMNELVDKWDRKLQKERVKYEGLVETLETQNEKLQSALEHEKSHKQAELQDQRAKLEEQYKGEKEELRTEIEVFKVAVTQREHFKGLTDSEVANQYKRLANSIEDFARVEWSLSREGDWPLSDDRMRQLGKNPRKMKLQIVQNTLWMLLSKHVFCSPFRILGAAGEELDEGWAQIYSNGASSFEWPEISAEMERSRFENAKAYMNAVGSSSSGSSVNESFERSVRAVVNTIVRTLDRVAIVQAESRVSLETMVHLAAKIWLESCSQRYRIIVVISNGSGDVLSSTDEVDAPLRLVIRPDLKRYGDSQGKHLTRGEPVAGWKSLTEIYS